ncbi:MAG: ethanolamine ammonia-lyase subunit EutC [Actinomycetes bacterium]
MSGLSPDPEPDRAPSPIGGLTDAEAADVDRLWSALARFTHARVGLGRSGSGMPTQALLQFRADHALARDAVFEPFDIEAVKEACQRAGLEPIVVDTEANNSAEFLRKPFAGRQLSRASREVLEHVAQRRADAGLADPDVVFIVSDGLSALGVNLHSGTVLAAAADLLRDAAVAIGPVVIAHRGRVGLMNEVGVALRSASTAMLIGERPGLSAPDSVGAYFEYSPTLDMTDADRNCISNIRPAGLPLAQGAAQLALLVQAGLAQQHSGTALKVEAGAELPHREVRREGIEPLTR